VAGGPSEEDLERERAKKMTKAAAGHEDAQALQEVCAALACGEAEVEAWAEAELPHGKDRPRGSGAGPVKRRSVGLVFRKRQQQWCIQLWFRTRTHTLCWMPFDEAVNAARARDRIVLHLRGSAECLEKGFLNYPEETGWHVAKLHRLGRAHPTDASRGSDGAGGPAAGPGGGAGGGGQPAPGAGGGAGGGDA